MVCFHLYVGWFCGFDLKGHPAYKQQAGKFEKKNQSMTRSPYCWFITNIFFLSAKIIVLMKVNFFSFQDSKASKRGQLQYKWAGLVLDSAVLSVSHTSVNSTFQGQHYFLFAIYASQSPAICPN